MKFIAFILSIYILALNFTPCVDNSEIDDNVKTEISQTNGDEHQHQDSDLCSPFCMCHCCHINVIQFQFTYTKLDVNNYYTQNFFYLNGLETNYSTSILQPPRA
ncbi:hypothetical protein MKD41_08840 [Lutibacter sp. A64]|uniref:Uncharacterized protein n=1 Tax=Lutibacter oricola TaxID=762486 RepID=A0A1H2TWS7_9FLAO|nr:MULTISPECIES: DUF6660 family protein [Lutibacter]UMB52448.1 hypothetical protein MKD41_08840 [Lutibacter sp. A64]SDW48237.1 hypothetical protein SAMN05444411_101828 [Lutibacter oricola]